MKSMKEKSNQMEKDAKEGSALLIAGGLTAGSFTNMVGCTGFSDYVFFGSISYTILIT